MSTMRELRFVSDGQSCRGDLYLPEGDGPFLTVVMGHGFGLTKDCGLAPFRDAFLNAGHAVFLYTGQRRLPVRHFPVGQQHLAGHALTLTEVPVVEQKHRMAGVQKSIPVAAREPDVAGIIAQCPMMDGLASVMEVMRYAGAGQAMKMTGLGLWDVASSMLGLGPRMLPSAGKPGELAAMSSHDAYDGYTALMPAGVPNEVAVV